MLSTIFINNSLCSNYINYNSNIFIKFWKELYVSKTNIYLYMEPNLDKKKYARIHSIESFGTVDGPGIRFVLFLQGCSLKCKYCHNRDTWDINSGTYQSLDEILEKILRYKNYLKNGGFTATGGEPLLQADFLIELFKKLKNENIHTCIDTSRNVCSYS